MFLKTILFTVTNQKLELPLLVSARQHAIEQTAMLQVAEAEISAVRRVL